MPVQEGHRDLLPAYEMTCLDPIDLRDAEVAVAVANTPIFLARRLLEDDATRRAHKLHGAERIFGALKSICARKPKDLKEATEVYFYLISLSFDEDRTWLRKAEALAAPHIKWFQEIAEYLSLTMTPTILGTVQAPQRIIVDPRPTDNTGGNISKIIRV
jgi:hypothetical protein